MQQISIVLGHRPQGRRITLPGRREGFVKPAVRCGSITCFFYRLAGGPQRLDIALAHLELSFRSHPGRRGLQPPTQALTGGADPLRRDGRVPDGPFQRRLFQIRAAQQGRLIPARQTAPCRLKITLGRLHRQRARDEAGWAASSRPRVV